MRAWWFLTSIYLYSLLLVMAGRWHLPVAADFPIAYVDDFTLALMLGTLILLAYRLCGEHQPTATTPSRGRPFKIILRLSALYILLAAVLFFTVAQWWHYEFYRDYIHYASLSYASSWREILRGLDGFQGRYWGLAYIFGMLGLFAVADLFWKANIPSPKTHWCAIGSSLLVTIILGGAYTYVYYVKNVQDWQTQAPIPLSYKNPLLELVREKVIFRQELNRVTNAHRQAIEKIYGKGPDTAINSRIIQAAASHPNVIFIILESFRAAETGSRQGVSLTPNFDRIATNNFSPQYFYANANQTIKAEIASLCSIHDFVVGSSLSAYGGKVKMRCLPEIFRERGYETMWFHGAYSNFYNRNLFMPKMGFNHLYDRQVIEDELYAEEKRNFIRHWGIEDPYVYEYALKKMEQQKQPFFAEIMSLSSHHPFVKIERNWDIENFPAKIHGDMNNMYRKYQHAIFYTDRALGLFWGAFQHSSLYDNTIVVVVGDHGIWLFPDGMEESKNAGKLFESYVRLPLMIYRPGKYYKKQIQTPLSQVDIAPLIMAAVFGDTEKYFQSKLNADSSLKLLDPEGVYEDPENPVFASIGDGFFFRQNEKRCFPPLPDRSGCKDYLFRCVDKYNVLETNKECFQWSGDILNQASPNIIKSDPGDDAPDLVVDYYRKSIF